MAGPVLLFRMSTSREVDGEPIQTGDEVKSNELGLAFGIGARARLVRPRAALRLGSVEHQLQLRRRRVGEEPPFRGRRYLPDPDPTIADVEP